jgi:hypothetical protein
MAFAASSNSIWLATARDEDVGPLLDEGLGRSETYS